MATNNNNDSSELGQAIQDVTEKLSLLVHEEIELAKREVEEKGKKLAVGIGAAVAAGIFVVFGLIYLLHSLAWLIWQVIEGDVNSPWLGYLIVAVVIFLVGVISGLLAVRFFKRGSPPAPQMAIEEAKLIKETIRSEHPAAVQGPREEVRS